MENSTEVKKPLNKKILLLISSLIVVLIVAAAGWIVLVNKNQKSVSNTSEKPNSATTSANSNAKFATSEITSTIYQGDISPQLTLNTISLTGKGQQGIAIDPNSGFVYVGSYSGITNSCVQGNPNTGTSYLSVVDPAKNKEVAAVATDKAPIWPAVDDSKGLVYVAASSGSVAIHKLTTGEKTGSIQVGGLPHMPAFFGNIMVVSNTFDQSETFYTAVNLETNKVIDHYKGPKFPHPIFVDENKKIAYMMGVESGEVTEIDMTSGKPNTTFTLPGGVGQMSVSTRFSYIITSDNSAEGSLSVFDLTSKKKLASIGFAGAATPGTVLAVDDEAGLVFVIISDQNAVGVASLKSLKPLGYFKVGGCPYAVRIDTTRGKGFVSNSAGSLSEFDLSKLIDVLNNGKASQAPMPTGQNNNPLPPGPNNQP